jgi:chemotaxis protein CheD
MAPLGARRARVQAVLVGGASMFAGASPKMEVGPRNDAAVRAELARLRIPVVRADTGGSLGRTVRVEVETGRVLARAAGARDELLFAGWRDRGPAAGVRRAATRPGQARGERAATP